MRAGGIGHLTQWGPLLKIGVCGGRYQSSLTGQQSFKDITDCVGDITAKPRLGDFLRGSRVFPEGQLTAPIFWSRLP